MLDSLSWWQKLLLAIGVAWIGLAVLIGWGMSRFFRYLRDGKLESWAKEIGNTYTQSIQELMK